MSTPEHTPAPEPTLAALVTVYHKIDPEHLRECLRSLGGQTRPADQLIVVEDGPLSPELNAVLEEELDTIAGVERVRLPHNVGAGPASAAGLERVTATYLARLDADDVAFPQRFELQLAHLEQFPEIDVLGTALAEFSGTTDNVVGVRTLPEYHQAIAKYAAINSPVNNPSVMMKTAAVRAVGGYRDVHLMEDYDLYARLVAGGYTFHNLPQPLTYFRLSNDVFARRTGPEMLAAEREMQRNLMRYGLVSKPRALGNFVARSTYRALPTAVLKKAHHTLFHR